MEPGFHGERRRVPRFALEQLVSLTIHAEGQRASAASQPARLHMTGTCKDASLSGMYCLVARYLAAGTPVDFVMNLPSESMLLEPVRLRGTGHVVRVQALSAPAQYGIGISFDSIRTVLGN